MTDIQPAPAVAVLGLGAMGLPMARRLAGAFPVRGYDPAEALRTAAEASGIACAGSAMEAVTGARIVLLAVRNAAQVEDVLFGPDGVAAALKAGSAVIMSSTVGVDAVPAWTERLAALGVDLIDAPLSGGPVRAAEGDLLIVVAPNRRPWRRRARSLSGSPPRSPWWAAPPVTDRR